jgi:hypothetical protein
MSKVIEAAALIKQEPPESIRRGFPRTWYFPKWRLLTWHPQGVLNAAFAAQVLDFVEMQEHIQEAPFDRYMDASGLTDIRLKLDHVITIARRRRKARQPVKSALMADKPVTFAIAQMYEHLMEDGMIEVRAFDHPGPAAEWLEVPPGILRAP